jgi:formyl-CoA transferase
MTRTPPSTALEDLTVLDMTQARAGPICVRQLADWGANCIKIERPGDPQDWAGRTEPDFQSKHRNKRSMILDLKNDQGRAVLMRMVAQADVVVENFRPGVKDRLGFDYDSLRAVNPRIILGSISAFGQDGPYRDRPGLDQIVQGMSGFMSINGEPGRGPLRAGVAISDITCGLFCAIGILTALHERERSGEGQWVQTSLMESILSMMDLHTARYLMEGHISKQQGNGHPTGVPTNAYQTSDGYVNVSIMPRKWAAFCKALDCEEAIGDPRYETREARIAHRDDCNAMIAARMKTYTTDEILKRLADYDCPAGPVYTIDQAFADPQAQHLELAQPVAAPDGGDFQILRQPFALSRTPTDGWAALSAYGADTDEILAEFGFGESERATLKKTGAIAGQ